MTPDFSYFNEKIDQDLLREAAKLSWASKEHGNTPFAALLVDGQGKILIRQENKEISESDCTGHAETSVARAASKLYSKDFLKSCSLYSTAEPCAMCAGAIYWAGIGRLVYGISEKRLLELTGSDEQNPTLDLPCRLVFDKGQKDVVVVGPTQDPDLEKDIVEPHLGYWNK